MSLEGLIRDRFERSFRLYDDLVESIGERELASRLAEVRSNTIGGQLWCVVGARESYARAIAAGGWSGFSCSLDDPASPAKARGSLSGSAAAVLAAIDALEELDDSQRGLVLDLLEHEAAHQGQLIRYLYGLRLAIPASWKARYALD